MPSTSHSQPGYVSWTKGSQHLRAPILADPLAELRFEFGLVSKGLATPDWLEADNSTAEEARKLCAEGFLLELARATDLGVEFANGFTGWKFEPVSDDAFVVIARLVDPNDLGKASLQSSIRERAKAPDEAAFAGMLEILARDSVETPIKSPKSLFCSVVALPDSTRQELIAMGIKMIPERQATPFAPLEGRIECS